MLLSKHSMRVATCIVVRNLSTGNTIVQPKTVLSIQSHVVSGAAGNSAAVFPMRRAGVNVWPLNTVQFSNHTQYGKWTGQVFPPGHLKSISEGINDIDMLQQCDAVLSGYLGSEEQGAEVLDVVAAVKKVNPSAIYCCDPVMGHPEKGCIVAPGVAEFFASDIVKAADIICPNVLELEIISGKTISSLSDIRIAIESIASANENLKMIFVKHLGKFGGSDSQFEMLLYHKDKPQLYNVAVPLLHFDRPPVGVGDLTSGLILAKHLLGESPQQALLGTASAYYHVMQTTKALNQYELQLVASQDAFSASAPIHPDVWKNYEL
eukprot:m.299983 g.299983  ORF g.299983 m.299983 type:complete len:321 (-) comp16417_c3_seq1:393-1355(-)